MSLIERLEAAEVGSREFDCEVWCIFDGWAGVDKPPCVTTSLDAALALAERVLPGWRMHVLQDQDGMYQTDNAAKRWFCGIHEKRGPGNVMAHAPTPALALCIAILKAKETK